MRRTIRTFELHRDTDVTGISGPGVVAQMVEWNDGTVAMRWLSDDLSTTVIHRSMETVERLHCHGGSSRIVKTGELVLDDQEAPLPFAGTRDPQGGAA
jgi:citrate lyase alpha subunit